MTSYKKLFLSIAVFVVSSGLSISSPAFALQETGDYLHTPATALTDPSLVCGDHKCAPGELSVNPTPVVPVKGH